MSFNFMATVTICSDFGAQENSLSVSIVSPSIICHEVMEPDAMILGSKITADGDCSHEIKTPASLEEKL